jgi:hypothetical protein
MWRSCAAHHALGDHSGRRAKVLTRYRAVLEPCGCVRPDTQVESCRDAGLSPLRSRSRRVVGDCHGKEGVDGGGPARAPNVGGWASGPHPEIASGPIRGLGRSWCASCTGRTRRGSCADRRVPAGPSPSEGLGQRRSTGSRKFGAGCEGSRWREHHAALGGPLLVCSLDDARDRPFPVTGGRTGQQAVADIRRVEAAARARGEEGKSRAVPLA